MLDLRRYYFHIHVEKLWPLSNDIRIKILPFGFWAQRVTANHAINFESHDRTGYNIQRTMFSYIDDNENVCTVVRVSAHLQQFGQQVKIQNV